jgi:hypothetical protein
MDLSHLHDTRAHGQGHGNFYHMAYFSVRRLIFFSSRTGCVLCEDDGGLYLLFVKKGRRRREKDKK